MYVDARQQCHVPLSTSKLYKEEILGYKVAKTLNLDVEEKEP